MLNILTVGVGVLAATLVFSVLVARRRPGGSEAFGAITGLALP
jgi:hypothetical protein